MNVVGDDRIQTIPRFMVFRGICGIGGYSVVDLDSEDGSPPVADGLTRKEAEHLAARKNAEISSPAPQ